VESDGLLPPGLTSRPQWPINTLFQHKYASFAADTRGHSENEGFRACSSLPTHFTLESAGSLSGMLYSEGTITRSFV
jgi:hypothetical protein